MAGIVLRRIRGVVVSMALWAVPWAAVGAVVGSALSLGLTPWRLHVDGPGSSGGVPGALALAGAIVGAVNGLAFSVLVGLGERRRSVDALPLWRFALWGALATFGVVWLMFAEPAVAAAAAVPGAAMAAGALLLARRASRPPDEPGDSSPPPR